MNFTNPILPTDLALNNPVANLIRNSHREEVDRIFLLAKSTKDKQYKLLLFNRGKDIWRKAINISNKYASDNPHITFKTPDR